MPGNASPQPQVCRAPALSIYGTAARQTLVRLEAPYWVIDPETGLARVRDYVTARDPGEATRETYLKGIAKLAEYVCWTCHRPEPVRQPYRAYHTAPLPG